MKKNLALILLIALFGMGNYTLSQSFDKESVPFTFETSSTVTYKGISIIPTFTLDKPAVIFELSMGKRLTFEPEFRFSLEGKPWALPLWLRYKLIDNERFSMRVGAHPSLIFNTAPVISGTDTNETIVASRFLAGEISPSYKLTKNISVGMYYLRSRGLENHGIKNTNFLTLNSSISINQLPGNLILTLRPECYYLKIDDLDGVYFTTYFTLEMKNFPISVSAMINKTIQSEIVSDDFVWDASITYRFSKKYKEQ